jgi:5,6-dimethylbenzimidazole synthase
MNINKEEREAVYKTIFCRRDVRRDFKPDPIPEETLMRVLTAAHHAPSVGFSQPWDFILVKSAETRAAIKRDFEEAPMGSCMTCDRERNGPVVIGRTVKPEMDLYSTVCAVQNLWLAARAENLGVGWVSILNDQALRETLNIPESKAIIAYLCIGFVEKFKDKPELETAGWLPRSSLESVIHHEQFQTKS